MNKTLTFNFLISREDRKITIKREYAVPLPLVWDAYTNPEILDRWWAPKPWKARTKVMDFREGGQWLYAMEGPKGEVHWSLADYNNIEFQKRFTVHDAFTDAEGKINEEMPRSKWDVSFNNQGQSTLVTIIIYFDDVSQLDETIKMGFKEGMTIAMEGLDGVLASLKK